MAKHGVQTTSKYAWSNVGFANFHWQDMQSRHQEAVRWQTIRQLAASYFVNTVIKLEFYMH